MHSKEIIQLVKEKSKQGLSEMKISELLNIKKSTVHYMIHNNYERFKMKPGNKSKLTKFDKLKMKRIVDELLQNDVPVTALKVSREIDTQVSKRTMQRSLKSLNYKFGKCKKSIQLTKSKKATRLELCKTWLKDRNTFENIIFTDEKKFFCDGPESIHSYYNKKSRLTRNKRVGKGGGIMYHAAMTNKGNILIKEINNKMTSKMYIEYLCDNFIPFANLHKDNRFILQHDNASIHNAKQTKEYCLENRIEILKWPANSPDLNPVENLWSLLSQLVFDGSKFLTISQLRTKIESSIEYLRISKIDTIKKLHDSFLNRIIQCIEKKGNKVDY